MANIHSHRIGEVFDTHESSVVTKSETRWFFSFWNPLPNCKPVLESQVVWKHSEIQDAVISGQKIIQEPWKSRTEENLPIQKSTMNRKKPCDLFISENYHYFYGSCCENITYLDTDFMVGVTHRWFDRMFQFENDSYHLEGDEYLCQISCAPKFLHYSSEYRLILWISLDHINVLKRKKNM